MTEAVDRPERGLGADDVGTEPESIARNTGFALAVKLTGAAFTGVLTIFLVRYLGPAEYGIFALALGVGGLVLIPSDLGIAHSSARFIAEKRHDQRAVAEVVSDAVRLKLLISSAFSIALIVAAGPVADAYDAPDLDWPIRVLALAIFGQSLMLLCAAVFEALGRVSSYLRLVAAESSLEAGASIAIVLFGTGATGAMAGRAAAYAFAAGFGMAILARALRGFAPLRRGGHGYAGRIAGYGSALLIVDGAFTLFSEIDVLLIGALVSVPAVGLFQAPLKLTGFVGFLGLAARSGVAPRLARGREGPDREALERALRYLVLVQGVVLAPMVVWADPITDLLLGSDYAESAEVMRGLAPFAFMLGISPLLAGSVNYLGAARRRVPIAIAAVLVNVAIDVALLPEIGIVAGAIGTDCAYGLYVVAHLLLCRSLIGLRLGPLLYVLVRALAAASVMAAVLFAFGTSEVAIPLLLVGGGLSIALYIGALVALRAVSVQELQAAGARVRAALPGRPS